MLWDCSSAACLYLFSFYRFIIFFTISEYSLYLLKAVPIADI